MFRKQIGKSCAATLRISSVSPIKIIQPAVVQVVRREQPAVAGAADARRRNGGCLGNIRACCGQCCPLRRLQGRARGDHVFPSGLAAAGAQDDVIESEILRRRAILADEAVAQEHVEPGEGGVRARRRRTSATPRSAAGSRRRGCAPRGHVFDDIDAVEEHRLDRVLPRPERQRVIAGRTEVAFSTSTGQPPCETCAFK